MTTHMASDAGGKVVFRWHDANYVSTVANLLTVVSVLRLNYPNKIDM